MLCSRAMFVISRKVVPFINSLKSNRSITRNKNLATKSKVVSKNLFQHRPSMKVKSEYDTR